MYDQKVAVILTLVPIPNQWVLRSSRVCARVGVRRLAIHRSKVRKTYVCTHILVVSVRAVSIERRACNVSLVRDALSFEVARLTYREC